MRDVGLTIGIGIGILVFIFICVAGVVDYEDKSTRCKRKGGTFVQSGRYGYICLKPGIVID